MSLPTLQTHNKHSFRSRRKPPCGTNVADDSLLHIAVASDQKEAPTCVRILLQHSANPNVLDRERYTPLHRAIINGHIEKAIELVEGNADINVTTPDGNTALHFAVMSDGTRSSIRKPLIMSILARAECPTYGRKNFQRTQPSGSSPKIISFPQFSRTCRLFFRT